MEYNYKVSIIVAIYNIENYIENCVKSLIKQSYENLEILLINDGSTDDSGKICKRMEKLDSRIKYYYKDNGGLSSARNYGLKKVTGDYVMFVDGDDFLNLKTVEILSNYFNESDIICFNYIIKTDDKEIEVHTKNMSDNRVINYILCQPSACTKIYKKVFLDKINFNFDVGILYEDLSIIPSLGTFTDKILFIDDCLYYYNIRDTSIMHNSKFSIKKDDTFMAINNLEKRISKDYKEEMEYIVLKQLVIMYSLEVLKYSHKIYKSRIKRIIKKIKCDYCNFSNNKYYKSESFANRIYIYLILNNHPLIAKILLFICKKNKDY